MDRVVQLKEKKVIFPKAGAGRWVPDRPGALGCLAAVKGGPGLEGGCL